MLHYHLALSLTPYLKDEREYVPWKSALGNLVYFATQFSSYDSMKKTDYYTTYKVMNRFENQILGGITALAVVWCSRSKPLMLSLVSSSHLAHKASSPELKSDMNRDLQLP